MWYLYWIDMSLKKKIKEDLKTLYTGRWRLLFPLSHRNPDSTKIICHVSLLHRRNERSARNTVIPNRGLVTFASWRNVCQQAGLCIVMQSIRRSLHMQGKRWSCGDNGPAGIFSDDTRILMHLNWLTPGPIIATLSGSNPFSIRKK